MTSKHARISLGRGESIEVEHNGTKIVIRNAGLWEQRLTRRQAWELAEALDEIATAGKPGDE